MTESGNQTPMFSLEGKVAVVTGAASGIGAATVQRLSAAGARTFLLDRDDASAQAAEVDGTFIQTDVSSEEQVAEALRRVAEAQGGIDALINNAGIALDPVPLAATTEDHYRRHNEVNAMGVLWGTKHGAKYMPRGSAIVNTASICGVMGFPEYGSYTASKFSVVALTQVAAMELGPEGIRVNCICPTSVNTPMLWNFAEGEAEAGVLKAASPLSEIIEPEHAAALIHFLVADDCPVISGQPVMIDCGISAGLSTGIWEAVQAKIEAPRRG